MNPSATSSSGEANSPLSGTTHPPKPPQRRTGTAKLSTLSERGGVEGRKLAAVILEVLAGGRTPTDAATAAGVSLPRYYAVEARALAGLVEACEPKPPGKRPSADAERVALRRDLDCARKECARYQALLRAAQRTIGLPAASSKPPAAGKRRRKPTVRALKAVGMLQSPPVAPAPADGPAPQA
ncbi:MAG: hypothetical protein HZA54_00935 [Planctomycetes bacterium]|nr:hypothetical protein [Planctomycetota bacterium]